MSAVTSSFWGASVRKLRTDRSSDVRTASLGSSQLARSPSLEHGVRRTPLPRIQRFRHAVAVHDEQITRIQAHFLLFVARVREQADDHSAGLEFANA